MCIALRRDVLAVRGAGYSGRAADMWACGASLFMWLYHRSPYTADNQIDVRPLRRHLVKS